LLDSIIDGIPVIKILNPDGSEAEKSGNGLRIFAKYLWDEGYVSTKTFEVITPSGQVTCSLCKDGDISVIMGRASFKSSDIPILSDKHEVVNDDFHVGEDSLKITAVSMGNPHCVIVSDYVSEETTRRLGPAIENHPLFPRKTNVQFVQVVDRNNLRAEIWERGAGYTLSSGSSSSAIASAVKKLGLCNDSVAVHMPGGIIKVVGDDEYCVTIQGAVRKVADGCFSEDFISSYVRFQ
jgi:diaminopimelate epimerase